MGLELPLQASRLLLSAGMPYLAELDVGPRVELELHPQASDRENRELPAFVEYCIDQIERDLGRAARWKVTIAHTGACFSCEVVVERDGIVIRGDGDGFDGAVAGRNAFVKIDKRLRAHLDGAELEVACVAR